MFLYVSVICVGAWGMMEMLFVCWIWKAHYLYLVQEPVKCAFSNHFGQTKQTVVYTGGWNLSILEGVSAEDSFPRTKPNKSTIFVLLALLLLIANNYWPVCMALL